MKSDQIFTLIKQNTLELLPELANRPIQMTDSLRDLGANSIDRAEILIKTMANLNLKVPLIDFARAKNIEELVNIFLAKLTDSAK